MAEGRKQAEIAAAAVLRVLDATPGEAGVQSVAEIIEIALHDAAREHEKKELKRIAEVQASAHAHLSRLLNASPAVIYCREASGDFAPTFVSESVTRLFGCTSRQYLEDPYLWRHRVHPDDVARINEWVDRMFESDERSIEYRIRRDDGTYFWVNDQQQVVRDAKGEPVEIVGSWTDVTERKEAEAARERARERLDLLLGAAPVVVYSFVATGDFAPTFVSASIEPMLGYRPEEYMQDADFWRGHVHPEDLPEVEAKQVELFRAGEHLAEYRFRKKDGSYCWVSDEQHLIRDKSGRPIEVVGSWSDIDARKAAEQAFQAAQEELEKATAAALEASEAKSVFLANMSHEIRTPMNAVIGLSHLALKTDLTPRQRDYVLKIKSSGQHLLGIINDILDFSKIEAGKLSIENIDFDLDKVLENVGNLMSEKAAAKGLELIFDVEPQVSTHFRGDPLRLGQILINFCNNAVKFTETGEVAVQVRVLEDKRRLPARRVFRERHRHRHERGANRAAVSSLRAGRRLHYPQIWRHRAWLGDLQAVDRADGRRGLGQERDRQGQYLPVYRTPRQRDRNAAPALASIRPARPARADHRRQSARARRVGGHADQHDPGGRRGGIGRGGDQHGPSGLQRPADVTRSPSSTGRCPA